MSARLELLRWVNEKCPQLKASNIESLSDGRHFLCLLKKYFPDIEVPILKKNQSISSKLENLNQVQQYCSKLDIHIQLDLYKIANKDSSVILNLLKQFRTIFSKTPIKNRIQEEEFITIIKQPKTKDYNSINEELIQEQLEKKIYQDAQIQVNQENFDQQFNKIVKLKEQFLFQISKGLQSPFLEIELFKMLEPNENEISELKSLLIKKSRCKSKFTEYQSIHSSQFFRGEQNLLDVEYSFDQQQASKKSMACDSLFQVSDEKAFL